MAQYSFHGQIIGRGSRTRIGGDGKSGAKTASRASAVASAAYRAGACLRDDQSNVLYDYTRKGGVVFSTILLPENAPERFHDRQTLWNAVQKTEVRKDAQLSREIRIALPRELTQEQNIQLLEEYLKEQFVSRGMVVDVAYHDPKGNNHNPHAHIMLTLRPFTRGGNWRPQKQREWNSGDLYGGWRESWARTVNGHLERAGIDARIDHRSYKEQGLDRMPTVHLGKDATALERSGVMTEKGNFNRTVRACNELTGLGVEPDGLLRVLREIGQKVRECQGRSRKAEVSPEREAVTRASCSSPHREKALRRHSIPAAKVSPK